jgi:hypothetical protein
MPVATGCDVGRRPIRHRRLDEVLMFFVTA